MTDRPWKLEMADHYYAVSENMRVNAQEQFQIADRLERYADMLCEQNIKETAKEPAPEAAATAPGVKS